MLNSIFLTFLFGSIHEIRRRPDRIEHRTFANSYSYLIIATRLKSQER
jgi:hypothetical protein